MAAYKIDPELERIIRPIVEGQIRGFLKERPKIAEAVDWYKSRPNKAETLTNSLTKRIVRDLACGSTTARLRAVLVENESAEQQLSSVEIVTATKRPWLEESLAKVCRALSFTCDA